MKEEHFRYRKSSSEFVRQNSEGNTLSIGIDLIRGQAGERYKIWSPVRVRIKVFEEVYAHLKPGISKAAVRNNYTFSVNGDELIKDDNLINSMEVSSRTVQDIARQLVGAYRERVFPFFEEFGRAEAVADNFLQDDPMKWITSDRWARYMVVLSCAAIRADAEMFDKYARMFLEFCELPQGQMYQRNAEAVVSGIRSEKFEKGPKKE